MKLSKTIEPNTWISADYIPRTEADPRDFDHYEIPIFFHYNGDFYRGKFEESDWVNGFTYYDKNGDWHCIPAEKVDCWMVPKID